MSTLAEIEEAIVRLPSGQVDKLAAWLDRQRAERNKSVATTSEPDFVSRARRVWGDRPSGKALSELVSDSRG